MRELMVSLTFPSPTATMKRPNMSRTGYSKLNITQTICKCVHHIVIHTHTIYTNVCIALYTNS